MTRQNALLFKPCQNTATPKNTYEIVVFARGLAWSTPPDPSKKDITYTHCKQGRQRSYSVYLGCPPCSFASLLSLRFLFLLQFHHFTFNQGDQSIATPLKFLQPTRTEGKTQSVVLKPQILTEEWQFNNPPPKKEFLGLPSRVGRPRIFPRLKE